MYLTSNYRFTHPRYAGGLGISTPVFTRNVGGVASKAMQGESNRLRVQYTSVGGRLIVAIRPQVSGGKVFLNPNIYLIFVLIL